MTEGRVVPITIFIGVDDVVRAVGCSRSQAYAYLREAARREPGQRGLLRVPIATWERFAEQRFPSPSPSDLGEARPRIRNKRRPVMRDVVPDAPIIPITRPRTTRR